MNQKKPVLGRGLDALLGQMSASRAAAQATSPAAAPVLPGDEFAKLPLDVLQRGRYQPRVDMRQESLEELANSIRAQGVVQPIVVRPIEMPGALPGAAPLRYEIIAGERRWRAAQLAQLHEVPIVIKDLPDRDALEVALVENIQRQDLNAVEEAEGYRRLIDEFGHTQEDLAKVVGKSRSHVANLMRLLTLPEGVRKLVEAGQLSAGHARALVGRDDSEALARKIVDKGLTVRQVERLVTTEKSGSPTAAEPEKTDPNTAALQHDLETLLGMRVKVTFDGSKGALTVYYNSLDQLDGLLSRITHRNSPGS